MNPLTLTCERVQQFINAYFDGELEPAERAATEEHLAECAQCAEGYQALERALKALTSLTAEDLARLRGETDELDPRPLSRAVFAALAAVLLMIGGFAWVTTRGTTPPPSPAPIQSATLGAPTIDFPLPAVGAVVGVEVDPEAPRPLPAELVVPAPEPVEVLIATVEPPEVVEAEPVRSPEQEGGIPVVRPVARRAVPPIPAPPKVVAKKITQLPERTQAFFKRLQIASGISYRGVTLFFIRDPEGRDRLAASRTPVLPAVREDSPLKPERAVVRPARATLLLAGELLDAPLGLRIAPRTEVLRAGKTSVDVLAVAWDGLKRRPEPLLKAPVVLPSAARLALLRDDQPGPVAVFLQALSHPTFSETRRLANELARIESEARELERRLRARVEKTRGLRGVAISVDGTPRSLDVFASGDEFAVAFPKLLRGGMLEERLVKETNVVDLPDGTDPRSAKILGGVVKTLDSHKALLKLLAGSTQSEVHKPTPRIDAVFVSPDSFDGTGRVYLQGTEVLHGLAVSSQ